MLQSSHIRTLRGFLTLRSLSRASNEIMGNFTCDLDRIVSKEKFGSDDWKALKSKHDVSTNVFAVNALIHLSNNLEGSRSLFRFLESENDVSFTIKYQLLKTILLNRKQCTPNDLKFIESTCLEVIQNLPTYPNDLVVTLMDGICLTSSWRENGLKLFEIAKSNSMYWPDVCGKLASAAFLHNETELGFQLLYELLSTSGTKRVSPYFEVLENALECISQVHDHRTQEMVMMQILQFLRYCDIKVPECIIWDIADWFEVRTENWLARFTDIHDSGQCGFCLTQFNLQALTEDEFSTLKTRVLENILSKQNDHNLIQELQAFKDFLEQAGPYTMVVDLLSLISKHRISDIEYLFCLLEEHGEKLAIIARENQRNNRELCSILEKRICFFRNDLSKAAPFVYYAALSGDQRTYMLCNDSVVLDRNTLDSIKDVQYLFLKWQEQNRVSINHNSRQVMFPDKKYLFCQISEDSLRIHVPYTKSPRPDCCGQEPDSLTWLCLQNVGKEEKKTLQKEYPFENVYSYREKLHRFEDMPETKISYVSHRPLGFQKFSLVNHPLQ